MIKFVKKTRQVMSRLAILFLLFGFNAHALQILKPADSHQKVKQSAQESVVVESEQIKSPLQLLTRLKKSAKSGNARDQFSLANMYHQGIDIKQDPKLAFYWYQQVADQGYANAQYKVAQSYHKGNGVEKDFAKALSYYRLSAAQDYVDAQYDLATLYENSKEIKTDLKKAFDWYQRSAELGLGKAQSKLAKFYEQGIGTKKDLALAQHWYEKAAAQYNPEAQFELAQFFHKKDNFVLAMKFYTKAANQDHHKAQYELALLTLEKLPNPEDTKKALSMLLNLAVQDNHPAQFELFKIYTKGQITEKDDALARAYLTRAADAGHLESQYQLASLLLERQKFDEAIEYVDRAIEKNHIEAQSLKDEILLQMEKAHESSDMDNPITTPTTPLVQNSEADELFEQESTTPILQQAKQTTQNNASMPLLAAESTDYIADNQSQNQALVENMHTIIPDRETIMASLQKNAKLMDNLQTLLLSAQRGNPVAQHNLSTLFSIGALVKKDNQKAFILMQQAAKAGLTQSQNSLSMMYINGIGTPINYKQAYFWASTSARKGDKEGRQILQYLIPRI